MCGENGRLLSQYLYTRGSPPRVRGKLLKGYDAPGETRITPACAGKTQSEGGRITALEDHPRVCGENVTLFRSIFQGLGSPPRVRGKPCTRGGISCSKRITPACAGKTLSHLLAGRVKEDHPRVCGENISSFMLMPPQAGSPPRVRGKRVIVAVLLCAPRITPACAGKTNHGHWPLASLEDHPRVCGENLRIRDRQTGQRGSPPRVRGKRVGRLPFFLLRRITPACAGKTGREQRGSVSHGDHPRVCGENAFAIICLRLLAGSPPRVRGKPPGQTLRGRWDRITPACAGKTIVRMTLA